MVVHTLICMHTYIYRSIYTYITHTHRERETETETERMKETERQRKRLHKRVIVGWRNPKDFRKQTNTNPQTTVKSEQELS